MISLNVTSSPFAGLNETAETLGSDFPYPELDDLFPPAHVASKVFVVSIYVAMILVCGCGNLLIFYSLYITFRQRRHHNNTKLLLTNLAVSDFLVAVISAPLFVDSYINDTWRFGSTMCRVAGYTKNTSLYVSTNSLLAIAIHRFVVIRYPLRERRRGTTAVMVIVVWLVSAVVGIPTALYSTTISVISPEDGERRTLCAEHWPSVSDNPSSLDIEHYTVILFIAEFLIPLLVMIYCYSVISCSLRQHEIQQSTSVQESRKRTVRLLITIVVLFALCWLPYHAYNVYRDFYNPAWEKDKQRINLFYIVESIAMSNALCNTILYISINDTVRHCLRKIPYKMLRMWRNEASSADYPITIRFQRNGKCDVQGRASKEDQHQFLTETPQPV